MTTPTNGRDIPFVWALTPIAVLVGLLVGFMLVLPRIEPGFHGSGHVPLVLGAAYAAVLARAYGHRLISLEAGIHHAIATAMPAMLILLMIGMLMGTWLASGVVPALIYAGLSLLRPAIFLPTTCAVCSVVSLASGSSWSTAGTVGLSLVGVGQAMGIDPAMTAGAVVSGAYFGDKLSPLSDTTNLAPAMAGGPGNRVALFEHVRHLLYSTVPAWAIAMTIYSILSMHLGPHEMGGQAHALRLALREHFSPSLWHTVPFIVVFAMIAARVSALAALFAGCISGAILAMVQGVPLGAVTDAALSGYMGRTGHIALDALLTRGGLSSMAQTMFLILCAMAFGGVMEASGMLQTLAGGLVQRIRSVGGLVVATITTAFGMNVIAADQYISIIVTGRMFAPAYHARKLLAKNLSRALEDGGTVTSALVPWNTCGAFMAATLAVPTLSYAPFAFFNLLNPLVGMALGISGFGIARARATGDAPTT